MFSWLEWSCAFRNVRVRGEFLEREGREDYAKDAKKDKEKINSKFKNRTKNFGIFFGFIFASFAKPSRPLRSKIPVFLTLAFLAISTQSTAQPQGIGRPATPVEIQAWDIDVRPDFKGLPKGQGSVKAGEQVWENKCASCHGTFGESNEVFPPMVGYTTAQDVKAGRVASLNLGADAPTRTTMMKLSQLSTLWDYINRAMPWNAPKSLSTDDVYAVTAYVLNMANVLPDNFVLSPATMPQAQSLLPNRFGLTTTHAMWPGKEFAAGAKAAPRPDVQGSTCMRNCGPAPKLHSFIPDYARNQSGNLAEQMRGWGPLRGVDTSKTLVSEQKVAVAGVDRSSSAMKNVADGTKPSLKLADVSAILQRNTCSACHAQAGRLVGPSFAEIAMRYKAKPDAEAYLLSKIRQGGQGAWGAIPMPAQAIDEASARKVAQWLEQGAAQ